jgi:tRNA(fMet)-specific endonuclease VapC
MAKTYLIDTSAVIKYLNESLPTSGLQFIDDFIDEESQLSFISEIELQVWNPPNEQDLEIYKLFVYQADIIGIDEGIIAEAPRCRKGRPLWHAVQSQYTEPI